MLNPAHEELKHFFYIYFWYFVIKSGEIVAHNYESSGKTIIVMEQTQTG